MTWQTHQLLAVLNWTICLGIAWACICRLNSEICRHFKLARARYTLLIAGALASGLQPVLWGTWPTPGSVIFSGCVLAGMAINVVRWYEASVPCRRKEDLKQ